jgi:hypothetical protein
MTDTTGAAEAASDPVDMADRPDTAGTPVAVLAVDETARLVAPLHALGEPTEITDVVIVSFTANLGFFSKAAAGRARSRGARVTIVSDLSQTTFDPDAVRGAGWDWLDGRAWCHGAFHPKLIVAASDTEAALLVGSGNATPDGWVDNAEVWVRLNASERGCPDAVAGVAAWLTRLPEHVNVSPGSPTRSHPRRNVSAASRPPPAAPASCTTSTSRSGRPCRLDRSTNWSCRPRSTTARAPRSDTCATSSNPPR